MAYSNPQVGDRVTIDGKAGVVTVVRTHSIDGTFDPVEYDGPPDKQRPTPNVPLPDSAYAGRLPSKEPPYRKPTFRDGVRSRNAGKSR